MFAGEGRGRREGESFNGKAWISRKQSSSGPATQNIKGWGASGTSDKLEALEVSCQAPECASVMFKARTLQRALLPSVLRAGNGRFRGERYPSRVRELK